MKLKKIVSLAMAGVLAVSMLAGCSNGTGSSSSTPTQQPAADLTSQLVAELNDTVGVTFTADAGLETSLEKVLAYKGAESDNDLTLAELKNFTTLETTDDSNDVLETVDGSSKATDKKEETELFAKVYAVADSNVKYVVEKLVTAIAAETVSNVTMSNLPVKSQQLDDGYLYNFAYTGKIAVVPVMNEASTAQTTHYYVAFTITRTPTKTMA